MCFFKPMPDNIATAYGPLFEINILWCINVLDAYFMIKMLLPERGPSPSTCLNRFIHKSHKLISTKENINTEQYSCLFTLYSVFIYNAHYISHKAYILLSCLSTLKHTILTEKNLKLNYPMPFNTILTEKNLIMNTPLSFWQEPLYINTLIIMVMISTDKCILSIILSTPKPLATILYY